jgi:phosphoribosyl-AMP cyclohydrolase
MADIQSLMETIKFDASGLVPAIASDCDTDRVLMLAYMNREALNKTLETGVMTYWSRSRQQLWIKGETSGNIQKVVSVRVDCDGDALLFKVKLEGAKAACHQGYRSCFYRELKDGGWEVSDERIFNPEDVYGKES